MLAPHQHAGTGHCNDVALGQCQAEIARIIRWRETEGMARDARRREEHAGVLHLVVGIEKLRTDHRHFRPLTCSSMASSQSGWITSISSLRNSRYSPEAASTPTIVEMRPVEFIRHRYDLVGVLLQPELPGDLVVGDVIDADDLEVAISGAFTQ